MLPKHTLDFVPLLLWIQTNISDPHLPDPEYFFDLNKTTVVHGEPLQTTYLNATVICQPYNNALYCLLQNVTYLATLKYKNSNNTEEIWTQHNEFEQWFEINFENSGIKDIRMHKSVHKEKNKLDLIKNIIKDVANQFDISNNDVTRLFDLGLKSNFSELKDTSIGNCTINYSMNVTLKNKMKQSYEYRITPRTMLNLYYTEKHDVHVHIKKKRQNCEYSAIFVDFLNGMEMINHTCIMEIAYDKLNLSTIMDVQLPSDTWNPSRSLFSETTLLSLTSIRLEQKFNAPHTSYSIII